ncbi:MAG: Ppx/GppA phosphatase family protein [Candidatus Korobacteraceae bacterium]
MLTLAAVDIGANSVRLKVARLERHRMQVVQEDREVTRLGESVFRTGLLDPKALHATVKILQRFHKICQTHGASAVRVVATSALRDARNASAFLNWARSTTGWRVEVISGLEEGRLIHLGVISGTRLRASKMLLIDLGGGSCEVTVSAQGQIRQLYSLPIGAVRLTQEFLRRDPPKQKELTRLRSFIAEEIGRYQQRLLKDRVTTVLATSGTPAALAGAWHGRESLPGDSSMVPARGVAQLAAKLSKMTAAERRVIPGIGPRRAEIIVAGAWVFAELMDRLKLPGFRYSPLGLRDGVLAQMAADYGPSEQMRKRIASERSSTLLNAGEHYGVDQRFAQHVRDLAVELFRRLAPVHELPPDYSDWLAAAAMLHEVGSYLNRAGRHRHTHYIVANSEMFGYTLEQRRIIAAIARYVGKSRPSPADRPVALVPALDRPFIPKAVILLRLARALDQGRRRAVSGIDVRVQDDKVILRVRARRSGAELEIWALEKEAPYFRELFGRDLVPLLS